MNNTFETIIVNRHLLINDGRGNMLIDTGSPASFHVESFTIMSIPGICMKVNGQRAKLLFDTGAHISYISDSYYQNIPIARQSADFSPLLNAEFNVDLYNLPTHFYDKMVNIEFGSMPLELTAMMLQLHVDGIVGYDLIQHFRIVLDKGIVKIPPQGI